ncbi:MAG TPA: EAL domain-containing protein [Acidimicrobiales bacterium]|nr:EAL domain-containing protein [Acidimicrobiales bacterium]
MGHQVIARDSYEAGQLPHRGPAKGVREALVTMLPKAAWARFLIWEALLALIYFPFGIPAGKGRLLGMIPWMEWSGQVPAWALLGLSSVAAIAYGAYRYRPRMPVAWWFIGAGVTLFITGDTIYKSWHQLMGQQNIPFPSFIDAIYITMYPVLAIGLVLLARARVPGGDQASLLDALMVTLGLGLISWIFLIGPNVRAPGGMLVRLTSAAYPLGDILLLAMLAHLWSAGGLRNAAGRLLTIGTVGTLVADTVYGLAGLHPSFNWHDGNPFDLGWIFFYSCWGAAALHPSMRELSEPRPVQAPRTTRSRLVVLGAISLVGPVALLSEAVGGTPRDAGAIAAASALMFLLVVARMSLVVKAHGQAVMREQVLRREAAQLVGAPNRAAIYEAVTRAVSELVGGRADVLARLAVTRRSSELAIVSASPGVPASGRLDLSAYPTDVRSRLEAGQPVRCLLPDIASAVPPGRGCYCFACPIGTGSNMKGVIEVRSGDELGSDVTNVLETLAAQVGLALDREELSEASHARRSEARFRTLVQNASDVILITRPDTTITYQTPSSQRILGYAPGSLEGTAFTSLLHSGDMEKAITAYVGVASRLGMSTTAEWRVRHSDGSWKHMEVVANNLLSEPTVEGIVLTLRDVSEQKNLENELKHQAFHDALTGLANRALFRDRLEHALARSARSLNSLAVLFLDIDDFKLVNDSLGHAAGDDLLVEVARRLMGSLRTGDTAARFGGDEFAVLLEETVGPEDACLAAERILNELRPPVQVKDRPVTVHASIGIAYSKLGHEDPAELLQAADVAMYAAKGHGKNCFQLYEPALQAAVSTRLERTAELQRAVDEGQFILHYQPIVSLDGGETIFLEALIRWAHPEKGLIQPADFIQLAEETGLIIPMGNWVLGQACPQVKQWQDRFDLGRRLKVTVNISARHFQHGGLIDDVSRALAISQLDPSCLVLEITETLLVHDAQAVIARMDQLKALGIGFAVDDFGTGYSSLSYLKRFPIDILKVDKSFVDDVGDSEKALALADAIVQLGRSLNLDTVAEGIEQPRQAEGLRELGCNYGQGFLFARPGAPEQIAEMLPLIASGELVRAKEKG